MLSHRLRRWPNIKTTLVDVSSFIVIPHPKILSPGSTLSPIMSEHYVIGISYYILGT